MLNRCLQSSDWFGKMYTVNPKTLKYRTGTVVADGRTSCALDYIPHCCKAYNHLLSKEYIFIIYRNANFFSLLNA